MSKYSFQRLLLVLLLFLFSLFVVFLNSFRPQGGSVAKVTIIPSDFGLQRMRCEDVSGPAELLDNPSCSHDDGGRSHEGRGFSSERLRQYQLQRLDYYYAIVECDSSSTAEHIYEQCDGLEYEHCGGKLDLRWIVISFAPLSLSLSSSLPPHSLSSLPHCLSYQAYHMTYDSCHVTCTRVGSFLMTWHLMTGSPVQLPRRPVFQQTVLLPSKLVNTVEEILI